jgi:carbamoyltransferase
MSSIYGIFTGSHSQVCAFVKNGEIVSVIEEERLTRIKAGEYYDRQADLSVEKIQEVTGLRLTDADYNVFVEPIPEVWATKKTKGKYETVSHHDAHCYGAYFTSGMKGKVMTISYDGGGESSVLKVYLCENGKMNLAIHGLMSDYGSLAHLWGFSTSSMKQYDERGHGIWKMCKDEGKLMGMAPNGYFDKDIYNMISSCIKYEKLRFFPSGTASKTQFVADYLHHHGYFDTLEGQQIYCYNLQKYTEDIFLRFMEDLHVRYPEYTQICFAGGLFGNVKLNQRINELPWVDEIYIMPPMGDEGLALGACIIKANSLGEWNLPKKFQNVYFGPKYSEGEVNKISKTYNFNIENYNPSEIAKEIHQGSIIGWYQHGSEHGPRALGARSILVRPTDIETHKILNRRLHRYDTMPFAPIVMEEFFESIFENPKSKYSAEFMTICYSTKAEWIEKIPAVIQKSDKTARPQLVRKDKLPKFWEILNEYYKISGIPVLLNTSFNSHNEPIIENPSQAFNSLEKKIIDKLVIGNYVYSNK